MFCKEEAFILHPHCFTNRRGGKPRLQGPWLRVPEDGTVPPRQLLWWRGLRPLGPAPDWGALGTKRKSFLIFCFLVVSLCFYKESLPNKKKRREVALWHTSLFHVYARSPQYGHPTYELRARFSIGRPVQVCLTLAAFRWGLFRYAQLFQLNRARNLTFKPKFL